MPTCLFTLPFRVKRLAIELNIRLTARSVDARDAELKDLDILVKLQVAVNERYIQGSEKSRLADQ